MVIRWDIRIYIVLLFIEDTDINLKILILRRTLTIVVENVQNAIRFFCLRPMSKYSIKLHVQDRVPGVLRYKFRAQHIIARTFNFHFWGADPPFRGVKGYFSAKTKLFRTSLNLRSPNKNGTK